MKRLRLYLRSVPGQLALFGVVLLGAAVLACLPYFFRSWSYFEGSVYEKYPELPDAVRRLAGTLGDPDKNEEEIEAAQDELKGRERKADPQKGRQDLEAIYGAWIEEADGIGDDKVLARRLLAYDRDWVIARLKRTLAAGSEEQRGRALRFLRAISQEKGVGDEVKELVGLARKRASRRGETKLVEQADAVLR